jgi:anthranilate 1,2-dioxygenase small subunit
LHPDVVRSNDATIDAAQLDQLLGAYAAALDGQDWQAWLGLFAEECSYAVYSIENAQAGLPLGYMIDDRRERLLDRVNFITNVWAGTIEPYRTRHIIQRVWAEHSADGVYNMRANMIVSYAEKDQVRGILVSGYYEDVVQIADGGPRFVKKAVYLDGTPARYLAYPL